VFNTAELGIAKPDPAVFVLVCEQLGVDPTATLFVDDLQENIEGAGLAGLHAHQHVSVAETAAFLAGWNLA
jgi:putative hydrolase of the HAD superfamily